DQARVSTRAYSAGPGHFVGNEPAEQRRRGTPPQNPTRGDSWFYAGPRVNAGDMRLHRRRHRNNSALGRYWHETIEPKRNSSHRAVSSAKTFFASRVAHHGRFIRPKPVHVRH